MGFVGSERALASIDAAIVRAMAVAGLPPGDPDEIARRLFSRDPPPGATLIRALLSMRSRMSRDG